MCYFTSSAVLAPPTHFWNESYCCFFPSFFMQHVCVWTWLRNNVNCHIWSLTASLCLSVCWCCVLTNSLSCSPISAPHNWNNLRQSRKKESEFGPQRPFSFPFSPKWQFSLAKVWEMIHTKMKKTTKTWHLCPHTYKCVIVLMVLRLCIAVKYLSLIKKTLIVTPARTVRHGEVKKELSVQAFLYFPVLKLYCILGAEWTKAKLGRHTDTDSRLGSRCCWHRAETRSENH